MRNDVSNNETNVTRGEKAAGQSRNRKKSNPAAGK